VFWLACPALLRARAVHPQLAQDQARLCRVHARAGDVGPGAPRARAPLLHLRGLGRDDPVSKAMGTRSRRSTSRSPGTARRSPSGSNRVSPRATTASAPMTSPRLTTPFTVSSNVQRAEQLTQRYHVEGGTVDGRETASTPPIFSKARQPMSKLIELVQATGSQRDIAR